MSIRSLSTSTLTQQKQFPTIAATPAAPSLSGGTEVTSGGFKYHTFTSSGTLTVTGGTGDVEVLLIAGGAGGGDGERSDAISRGGGGGGAGGLLFQSVEVSPGSYSVVIGTGGGGGAGNGVKGSDGNDSTFAGLTALGGGGGGAGDSSGNSGGSGGGHGGGVTNFTGAVATQVFPGYGSKGGGSQLAGGAGKDNGSGGGGAGDAGQCEFELSFDPGTGGLGVQITEWATATSTGDNNHYASGGTGGERSPGGSHPAPDGGGGDGNGGNATDGTGGGGGGGAAGGSGGDGGDGLLIVRVAV